MNKFFKRLLFVRKCTICDKALPDADEDAVFCEDCFRQYQKMCRDVCPDCEREEWACACIPRGMRGKVGFSAHLFRFRDEFSRKLVYSLKLKNYPFLQRFFASEIADMLKKRMGDDLSDFTMTYAPRKPKSIRIYGFDQSKVVAELAAQHLQIPFATVFCHARISKLQKRLDAKGRSKNAVKSYFLNTDYVRKTDKLLILDDVTTTGSTLSVLVSLAKEAGFREVSVVCIARASRI